jgi:malonate-semialdehyde dehydrogenase (acetylating) / methylmalonate-semialdehyde dehydrogenase
MMRGQTLARRTAALSVKPSLRVTARHLQTSSIRVAGSAAINEDYIKHHSQVTKPSETFNFLNNQFQKSSTDRWIDLRDPATRNLVTRVPETTQEEMLAAVDSAETAFKTWKNTSLLSRQQIMFRLATLIRDNMDRLAASITLEQVPKAKPRRHAWIF